MRFGLQNTPTNHNKKEHFHNFRNEKKLKKLKQSKNEIFQEIKVVSRLQNEMLNTTRKKETQKISDWMLIFDF